MNSPSTIVEVSDSNTEEPFTMQELDSILTKKLDTDLGMDGMKYSDIRNFPEHRFLFAICKDSSIFNTSGNTCEISSHIYIDEGLNFQKHTSELLTSS